MRALLGVLIVLATGACVTTTANQRAANEAFEQALLASQQAANQAAIQAGITQMINDQGGQAQMQATQIAQMQAIQMQAMQPPP